MAIGTLNEIMQQVVTLNSIDKLTLATYLIEQVKKNGGNGELSATGPALPTRKFSEDVPDRSFRQEYEWLNQHRHEYPGQYLLIEGDRLVSHGTDLRQALAEARNLGAKFPLMVRVEAADELPFGGW